MKRVSQSSVSQWKKPIRINARTCIQEKVLSASAPSALACARAKSCMYSSLKKSDLREPGMPGVKGPASSAMLFTSPPAQNAFLPAPRTIRQRKFGSGSQCDSASLMLMHISLDSAFRAFSLFNVKRATPLPGPSLSQITSLAALTALLLVFI
eukprot:6998-Heterococcus_DN1.PRE.1